MPQSQPIALKTGRRDLTRFAMKLMASASTASMMTHLNQGSNSCTRKGAFRTFLSIIATLSYDRWLFFRGLKVEDLTSRTQVTAAYSCL
jgi:hypothetical protein